MAHKHEQPTRPTHSDRIEVQVWVSTIRVESTIEEKLLNYSRDKNHENEGAYRSWRGGSRACLEAATSLSYV